MDEKKLLKQVCQLLYNRRSHISVIGGLAIVAVWSFFNVRENVSNVMQLKNLLSTTIKTIPGTFNNEKSFCPKLDVDKSLISKLTAMEGIYMRNTSVERPLQKFIFRPLKVENVFRKGVCHAQPDLKKWNMVYLVKSAAQNRDRRDVIRQTWGAVKVFDDVIFQVVFILGTSKIEAIAQEINKESENHGDILLCDEEDSAKFVPEKVLAGMQWSAGVLPNNWLYASIDDDIIVNPANLVDYFNKLIANHMASNDTAICFDNIPMACVYNYQSKDPPARNSNSKWYMPLENYPGEFWPVYCRGGMYTASSKMVKDLFEKSRRTAHLYLDDVWITGFMRRKLNMGDYNIVAPPMSILTEAEAHQNYNIENVLVKHLWGNIDEVKVDVSKEMVEAWKSLENNLKSKIQCEVH